MDRAAGIVTLASRLGPKGALRYYRICHTLPYGINLCLIGIFLLRFGSLQWGFIGLLLPFLALQLSIRTMLVATRVYHHCPENPPWRGLERASGGILLVYGVLYALSLALV